MQFFLYNNVYDWQNVNVMTTRTSAHLTTHSAMQFVMRVITIQLVISAISALKVSTVMHPRR